MFFTVIACMISYYAGLVTITYLRLQPRKTLMNIKPITNKYKKL
jgi:hypothetical protein